MNWSEWSKLAGQYMEPMGGKGAFLTTAHDGRVNTMTMSWSAAGVFWAKPVLILPVRFTRYTHELLRKSGYATVSIPAEGTLGKELAYCGTKCGRDVDKFAEMGLTAQPGRTVPVPVVAQAALHFECRVLYTTDMSPMYMDEVIDRGMYADHNYHTLFFAEVVDSYGK